MRQYSFGILLMLSLSPGVAVAQGNHAPAQSPIQSTVQGGDQPVQIDAASLDVQDKRKTATFTGDVQVVQGETTMKCQTLVVFYGQEVGIAANAPQSGDSKPAAAPGPKGAQDIRKIEARGGVTVVTKDQSASGDLGVYDLKSKTITLTGNVVVSQGQNVIHGQRVVVDTITGNARVESNEGGGAVPGRVRALILPNKGQNGGNEGNMLTIGPGRPN
jgi:lipopolysaccharide export system protein LptA